MSASTAAHVEDQPAVRPLVAAEILQVGVAAQLNGETGIRLVGEIGGHDGDGTAEERKRRGGHSAVLQRQKFRKASAGGPEQNVERF